LYGGKIRIESKVGEGGTFFFTFPKQKIESRGENFRLVLLVEDDAAGLILRGCGAEIRPSKSI
jgi:hypothetical protein